MSLLYVGCTNTGTVQYCTVMQAVGSFRSRIIAVRTMCLLFLGHDEKGKFVDHHVLQQVYLFGGRAASSKCSSAIVGSSALGDTPAGAMVHGCVGGEDFR